MSQPNSTTRRVSLFRNGRNQALRIPKEFAFSAKEAVISKDGDKLIIEPVRDESVSRLLAFLATLEPIAEDWPEIDDLPPDDVVI
jgi:antitoxin VapB